MPFARRPWFFLLFFATLVIASRYPLAPGQLFTFDDVNLAASIGHFDIRASQPQPPGYPIFVMEMRALWWLRFRRPESILLALSLAGSIAALALIAGCGNRIMGGVSGFCAACLMLFHPVFWHAGLASALRVQLAIISIVVGWACWRAWSGEGRWVLWSALALGTGAGIRPEMGPLLFPLWAACALRAPVSWRKRIGALAAMAAAVAFWLVPAMLASGGPVAYIRTCLDYISDQGSVSSGLLGASESRWRTTFWHIMVWVFSGIPGLGMAAVLAWRPREGWGFGSRRLAFLALWFVPAFAFATTVHTEDPGQTLAMSTVVALAGGYLVNRALENVQASISRWHGLIVLAASAAVAMILAWCDARLGLIWIALLCTAAGLLMRLAQVNHQDNPPPAHALVFLLAPVLVLNFAMFCRTGWYYRGTATSGWRAAVENVAADLNSGLALTSYEQISRTLAIDDHAIRQLRRLAAERPGATVVVWENGLTSWRKAAYYAPGVPVVVLDHRQIRAGSPPVAAIWKGFELKKQMQSAAPLPVTLPPGARVIWMLNPATPFYSLVRRAFPVVDADPVNYTDLSREPATRVLGEYALEW